MKLKEAKKIIDKHKPETYMVTFELREGCMLRSDHFPDKHTGEELFKSETIAWDWAHDFANATNDNYVNIYVIDSGFNPVKGYHDKTLKRIKITETT
jgi:hypothetical protein